MDQIEIFEQKSQQASRADVQIVIDPHKFMTLFRGSNDGWGSDYETIKAFGANTSTIEKRVDRDTLIRYSSLARDYFSYSPGDDELHLPVRYPSVHIFGSDATRRKFEADFDGRLIQAGKRIVRRVDDQYAFIRPNEIEDYIIPWLERVQKSIKKERAKSKKEAQKNDKGKEKAGAKDNHPKKRRKIGYEDPGKHLTEKNGPMEMKIPDQLLDKIHLYNAMLQLGLPRFVQLPFVDALVLQMYQNKISACHLDNLEITIGRFHARSLAILDPAMNALVGTYALRSLDDRRSSEPAESPGVEDSSDEADGANEDDGDADPEDLFRADDTRKPSEEGDVREADFSKTNRKYLDFAVRRVQRGSFGDDTYVLPPKLPVLGHNIRHWSGVRSNGSTAAAHMGFPLNVGLHKKFIRRDASTAIDLEDYEELQTNRLVGQPVTLPGRA